MLFLVGKMRISTCFKSRKAYTRLKIPHFFLTVCSIICDIRFLISTISRSEILPRKYCDKLILMISLIKGILEILQCYTLLLYNEGFILYNAILNVYLTFKAEHLPYFNGNVNTIKISTIYVL